MDRVTFVLLRSRLLSSTLFEKGNERNRIEIFINVQDTNRTYKLDDYRFNFISLQQLRSFIRL